MLGADVPRLRLGRRPGGGVAPAKGRRASDRRLRRRGQRDVRRAGRERRPRGQRLLEQRRALEVAGGVLVIAMGLILLGRGVPAFLLRERRVHLARWPATLAGSGLAGVAFAVGWTPAPAPPGRRADDRRQRGRAGARPRSCSRTRWAWGCRSCWPGCSCTGRPPRSGFRRPRLPLISAAGAAILVAFGVLLATGEMTRLTARLGTSGTSL